MHAAHISSVWDGNRHAPAAAARRRPAHSGELPSQYALATICSVPAHHASLSRSSTRCGDKNFFSARSTCGGRGEHTGPGVGVATSSLLVASAAPCWRPPHLLARRRLQVGLHQQKVAQVQLLIVVGIGAAAPFALRLVATGRLGAQRGAQVGQLRHILHQAGQQAWGRGHVGAGQLDAGRAAAAAPRRRRRQGSAPTGLLVFWRLGGPRH